VKAISFPIVPKIKSNNKFSKRIENAVPRKLQKLEGN
jgi:hypothetical protein